MKSHKRKIGIFALLIFAVCMVFVIAPVAKSGGGVVVIANESVAASSVSKGEISQYFLGKALNWKGGGRVNLAVLSGGADHETFCKDYVGKTAQQFDAYWKKLVFTGQGTPPEKFADDAEMVRYVSETKGAIGYVSVGASTDGVKVLTVN
jgi:ABC-type phosphate transport system substrate-binding protein